MVHLIRAALLLLSALVLLVLGACGESSDVSDKSDTATSGADPLEFVTAELQFAKLCSDSGMKVGFLANMTDDAHVFRPQPVAAKPFYESLDAIPGKLVWTPVFAEVSQSGDFGYTTGPWRYFASDTSAEARSHGQYITIWQRQADGTLKWPIDIGISHPPVDLPTPELVTSVVSSATAKPGDIESLKVKLTELDSSLNAAVREGRSQSSYTALSADDIRLYRNGSPPYLGKAAIGEELKPDEVVYAGTMREVRVGSAGDLGLTWGQTENLSADRSPNGQLGGYARIWRLESDGFWRLALEVVGRPTSPGE